MYPTLKKKILSPETKENVNRIAINWSNCKHDAIKRYKHTTDVFVGEDPKSRPLRRQSRDNRPGSYEDSTNFQ